MRNLYIKCRCCGSFWPLAKECWSQSKEDLAWRSTITWMSDEPGFPIQKSVDQLDDFLFRHSVCTLGPEYPDRDNPFRIGWDWEADLGKPEPGPGFTMPTCRLWPAIRRVLRRARRPRRA